MKQMTCVALSVLATLYSGYARGDLAPPPTAAVFSLTQEKHDVQVIVSLQNGSTAQAVELVREQDGKEEVVATVVPEDAGKALKEEMTCSGDIRYLQLDMAQFCANNAEQCLTCDSGVSTVCIGSSCDDCVSTGTSADGIWGLGSELRFETDTLNALCAAFPGDIMNDCDGDSENECCGVCAAQLMLEIWDRCVPPGETTYWPNWGPNAWVDGATVDVVDMGVPCGEEVGDAGVVQGDTDTDVPTDTGSDDSSSEEPVDSEQADSESGQEKASEDDTEEVTGDEIDDEIEDMTSDDTGDRTSDESDEAEKDETTSSSDNDSTNDASDDESVESKSDDISDDDKLSASMEGSVDDKSGESDTIDNAAEMEDGATDDDESSDDSGCSISLLGAKRSVLFDVLFSVF